MSLWTSGTAGIRYSGSELGLWKRSRAPEQKAEDTPTPFRHHKWIFLPLIWPLHFAFLVTREKWAISEDEHQTFLMSAAGWDDSHFASGCSCPPGHLPAQIRDRCWPWGGRDRNSFSLATLPSHYCSVSCMLRNDGLEKLWAGSCWVLPTRFGGGGCLVRIRSSHGEFLGCFVPPVRLYPHNQHFYVQEQTTVYHAHAVKKEKRKDFTLWF